jgi:hypothetical protein
VLHDKLYAPWEKFDDPDYVKSDIAGHGLIPICTLKNCERKTVWRAILRCPDGIKLLEEFMEIIKFFPHEKLSNGDLAIPALAFAPLANRVHELLHHIEHGEW